MKKYPIEKFYVGKVNFGFRFGNLAVPKEFTKYDYAQIDLKNSTLFKGAIDIRGFALADLTDWEKRIRYDSLFTIFYKNDDDNYTCLHNGITYHLSGENYCSDLVPLSSVIPKVASKVDGEITCLRAKMIFDALFKKEKKHLYTSEEFYLDNFYFGNLELFTAGLGTDENTAQELILASKGINAYGGRSGSEESYGFYKVIILWVDNSKLYGINDYRFYESGISTEDNKSKVKLISSLKDDPQFSEMIDGDKVSIPQVLKLQRKFITGDKNAK